MELLKELVKVHGIGLTGGIATGKSTVGRMIAAAGRLVIDADQLSRATTAPGHPGLASIVAAFGPGVLAADGTLDRKALGAIVFADPAARKRLEAISHPAIRAELTRALAAAGVTPATPRTFFYEAALLIETGTQSDFHALWVTYCAPDVQLQRLMARSSLDEPSARRIIAAQMPASEKAAHADVVIRTDGDLASVEAQVSAALAALAPPT